MDWLFPILVNKSMKWLAALCLIFPFKLFAQDTISHNWNFNGYITNMQSFMFQNINGDWNSDNLIHNRLNFNWHNTANFLNAAVELRNRFISGESVKNIPDYSASIAQDNGFIKLSDNIFKGNSYILNLRIDRAYIDYTNDKLQLRIGRQRINWGQCSVWNPNDLFNAYSFFDFDYIEKNGSDAIRLQYYSTSTSTFDLAIKADNNHKVTSALLYRFNKWNYDFQFLAGILNEEDYVLGTGWSGNIGGASFRGEVSYFRPKQNFKDSVGVLVASVGSDYTFKNSFMLQVEALYNQNRGSAISNFTDLYSLNLSPKNLSFAKFSFMIQGSYPVTPLLNFSLAGMYFPLMEGFFIGPSFTYSIANNIDFSIIAQSFKGKLQNGHPEYFNIAFLRLKCNF